MTGCRIGNGRINRVEWRKIGLGVDTECPVPPRPKMLQPDILGRIHSTAIQPAAHQIDLRSGTVGTLTGPQIILGPQYRHGLLTLAVGIEGVVAGLNGDLQHFYGTAVLRSLQNVEGQKFPEEGQHGGAVAGTGQTIRTLHEVLAEETRIGLAGGGGQHVHSV